MLAEALVQLGVLKADLLDGAKRRQQQTGEDLDECVLALQLVSEREMLRATARQLGAQYLTTERVAELKVPDEVMDRLPVRIAEALSVCPFRLNPDGTLWVLTPSPLGPEQVDQLRRVSEARAVSQILARRRAIRAALRKHYYRDPHAFQALEEQELLARLKPPVADLDDSPAPATGDVEIDVEVGGLSGGDSTPAAGSVNQLVTKVNKRVDADTTPRALSVLPEDVVELQRENERLRVAQGLAGALATVHHLDVLSTELLAAMLDLFEADAVGFALTGENGAPLLLESRRRDQQASTAGLAISSSIVRAVVSGERGLLVLDAQADDRFAREESILTRKVRSVVCAPIRSRTRVFGALYLEAISASTFDGHDLEMLTLIGTVAGGAVEHALTRQHLEDEVVTRHTLRRFLPQDEVDRSLKGEGPSLLPTRAEATLLVVRVADFAAFAAGDDPDEVMRRIDDLMDSFSLPIFAHGGTLQGEQRGGVAAVFGPPRDGPDHAERAVSAAVEIAKRAARGEGALGQEVRIGLATGPMVIGAMGPLSRVQFLAVGETPERAYQLAELARPGEIFANAATRDATGRFLTWDETEQRLTERGEPRPVYRLQWR